MAESADPKTDTISVTEEPGRTRQGGLPRLARSAVRVGFNLALVPLALLPDASQKHMRRAGSEFALGLAALLRSTSETLDSVAEEI